MFEFATAAHLLAAAPADEADLRAEADQSIATCREALDDRNGVVVVGRMLCLSGHTNAATLEAFDAVKDENYDEIVLRSAGGDVAIALDIAEYLLERRLIRATVWDYCMSSCANWLFLAAEEKVQTRPNVITWHGGPAAPDRFTEAQEPYREALTQLYQRSEAFYAEIDVDSSIMYTVPDGFNFDYDDPGRSFWVAPRDMLEGAGVTGLVIYDGLPETNISFEIR